MHLKIDPDDSIKKYVDIFCIPNIYEILLDIGLLDINLNGPLTLSIVRTTQNLVIHCSILNIMMFLLLLQML